MEQNDSEINNINGNKIICDPIECFASTAELLHPKKKARIEDLSTITIGYIKDKHPDSTTTKGSACYLTLGVALQ